MTNITLKELKAQVMSTQGKKLPTAKALREGARLLVKTVVGGSAMEVFSNGFAVYQNEKHYTVLRMEHVGSVHYYSEPEDKRESVALENEDWSIGVMLCGEERLEKRYQEMAESRLTSLYTDTEEGEAEIQIEAAGNFEEELAEKDEVHSILDCLTERQRQVVEMYYLCEMTQQQIADKLGITKQSVNENMKLAIKRIQKNRK